MRYTIFRCSNTLIISLLSFYQKHLFSVKISQEFALAKLRNLHLYKIEYCTYKYVKTYFSYVAYVVKHRAS